MRYIQALFLTCGIAAAMTIAGCGGEGGGSETSSGSNARHSADDGHDHDRGGHDDHAGHDHGDDDHADDGHHHGEKRPLGSLEVGGATLKIAASGEVVPNAEIDIDIEYTEGAVPAAIRVWIGDESGVGSLKVKADGHGNHFHVHAEVPASVDDTTALWIEVETRSGERTAMPVSLE